MPTTYSLSSIKQEDYPKIGIRGANLARLKSSGQPIKPSFAIPSIIFEDYTLSTGLRNKAKKLAEPANTATKEALESAYKEIKKHISQYPLPKQYEEELIEAYEALPASTTDATQKLLSSTKPTVNLTASPSYPASQDKQLTIYNITGKQNYLDAIRSCWLQLYTPDETQYRQDNGIVEFTTAIIVQPTGNPEKTAEATTKTEEEGHTLIKAYHGAPDIYAKCTKDIYETDTDHTIKAAKIAHQDYKIIYPEQSGTLIKRSNVDKASSQKIEEKEIIEIATRARKSKEILGEEIKIYITMTKGKQEIILADEIIETGRQKQEEEESKELKAAEKEIDEYISSLYEQKTGAKPENPEKAINELYARNELPAEEAILTLKKLIKLNRAGEPINPQTLQETIKKIMDATKQNGN